MILWPVTVRCDYCGTAVLGTSEAHDLVAAKIRTNAPPGWRMVRDDENDSKIKLACPECAKTRKVYCRGV